MKKSLAVFCHADLWDERKSYRLKNLNLLLREGEVLCLTGLSNAGEEAVFHYFRKKAWPIKGKIILDGREVRYPGDTGKTGCFFWMPEDNVAEENLSVMEYLMLLPDGRFQNFFWNDRKQRKKTKEILQLFGMPFTADMKYQGLSAAEKKILILIRGFVLGASVILLNDEYEEMEEQDFVQYKKAMDRLRENGTGFLVITKNIRFMAYFADAVYVFKNHRVIKKLYKNENLYHDLCSCLVQPLKLGKGHEPLKEEERYRVEFPAHYKLSQAFFAVNKGEVVILKVKSTQEQVRLFAALSGQVRSGIQIRLDGRVLPCEEQSFQFKNRIVAIRSFFGESELFFHLSLEENLMLPNVMKLHSVFKVRRRRAEAAMKKQLELSLRCHFPDRIQDLSQTEMMDVVMERWKIFSPHVLILLNPFLHMDYDSRSKISRWMNELSNEGTSICIITSEEEDYREICSKVIVLSSERL